MVNTYGLPMYGLEDASKATVDWASGSGYCTVIRYDPEDGKVWASDADESQLAGRYDVFRTARHVSAQRIADKIAEHVRLSKLTPQQRYDAANTVQIALKLNRKTDADILAHLSKQSNRQGYIKSVLRKELTAE